MFSVGLTHSYDTSCEAHSHLHYECEAHSHLSYHCKAHSHLHYMGCEAHSHSQLC